MVHDVHVDVPCQYAGTAVWPGEDGAAVALSAILRTTLAPVSLQYLPMLASYQAAFAGGRLHCGGQGVEESYTKNGCQMAACMLSSIADVTSNTAGSGAGACNLCLPSVPRLVTDIGLSPSAGLCADIADPFVGVSRMQARPGQVKRCWCRSSHSCSRPYQSLVA
jgi:hypothetical protein